MIDYFAFKTGIKKKCETKKREVPFTDDMKSVYHEKLIFLVLCISNIYF